MPTSDRGYTATGGRRSRRGSGATGVGKKKGADASTLLESALSDMPERLREQKAREDELVMGGVRDRNAAITGGVRKRKEDRRRDRERRETENLLEESEARQRRKRARDLFGSPTAYTQAFDLYDDDDDDLAFGAELESIDDALSHDENPFSADFDDLSILAGPSYDDDDEVEHERRKISDDRYRLNIPNLFVIKDNPDVTEGGTIVSFRQSDFPGGTLPYHWTGANPEPAELGPLIQLVYRSIEGAMNQEFLEALQAGRETLPEGIIFVDKGDGRYAFAWDDTGEVLSEEDPEFVDALGALVDFYNAKSAAYNGKMKNYYLEKLGMDMEALKAADPAIHNAFSKVDVHYSGFTRPTRELIEAARYETIAVNRERRGEEPPPYLDFDDNDEEPPSYFDLDDDDDEDEFDVPDAPIRPPTRRSSDRRRRHSGGGGPTGRPFRPNPIKGSPNFDFDGLDEEERTPPAKVTVFQTDSLQTGDNSPIRAAAIDGMREWWAQNGRLPVSDTTMDDILNQDARHFDPELELWTRLSSKQQDFIRGNVRLLQIAMTEDRNYSPSLEEIEAIIDRADLADEIVLRTRYHQDAEVMRRQTDSDYEENNDPHVIISRDEAKAILVGAAQKLVQQQATALQADADFRDVDSDRAVLRERKAKQAVTNGTHVAEETFSERKARMEAESKAAHERGMNPYARPSVDEAKQRAAQERVGAMLKASPQPAPSTGKAARTSTERRAIQEATLARHKAQQARDAERLRERREERRREQTAAFLANRHHQGSKDSPNPDFLEKRAKAARLIGGHQEPTPEREPLERKEKSPSMKEKIAALEKARKGATSGSDSLSPKRFK